MPNVGRSVAIVAAAIALVFIAFPIDVDAHAALDRSDPAARAIVSQPPSEIRLLFTEPLESTYTGADLLTSAGEIVPGTSVSISPANARELIVVPPADLGDGGYTVAWRTLSAADGHTLQGYFGFRTGAGAVGETSFSASVTSGNETARAVTRWFALLGLAGLLAIAPVTLVVLDPARRAVPALNRTMPVSLRRYSVAAA
ncbi:MAG: copper resistance protein CopC, partial [Chloroflexia bacterium]|nr:copper resistance protein CopC [Chloroflexia bacterium]